MINTRNDVANYSLFTIAIRKDKCGYSMEQLTKYCRKNLKYSYKQIISVYKAMIDLKLERIEDWDYENSDDELVQRKLNEIKEYKMEISRIKRYLKEMRAAKEAKELKSMHEIKTLSDNVSVVYGD